MIVEAARARTPLAMVNARMSQRSFERWGLCAGTASARCFSESISASRRARATRERLARLGARAAPVIGNLKYDAPAPPADRERTRGARGPDLRAADLDRGLDPRGRGAHRRGGAPAPDRDFPRRADPDRAAPSRARRGDPDAVAGPRLCLRAALAGRAARAAKPRSTSATRWANSASSIASPASCLVGKSLAGEGGQNPIEPAKLASAILHGPHVANFADVYALLDGGGGAVVTRDADELAATLRALFADTGRLRAMARAAASAVERQAGASDRAMAALAAAPWLARGVADVMAPRFWRRERPGLVARALSPLGALYGAATARRECRARARRSRRPSSASAISSSAARARRRPRSRSPSCCKARANASRFSRAATAGRRGANRCRSIRSPTARALVGDEPLLLARVAPCFVGADRVTVGEGGDRSGRERRS